MGIGETQTVDSVSGDDEETQVETEGNDSYDESEKSSERSEDTENEVSSECEEESDKGDSSGDRSEDESVGEVAKDGLGSDVLRSGELRNEVARVTQFGARASC